MNTAYLILGTLIAINLIALQANLFLYFAAKKLNEKESSIKPGGMISNLLCWKCREPTGDTFLMEKKNEQNN